MLEDLFKTAILSFFENLDITSVGGIMVSIAAFQAVDPGSIPGHRSNFFHFLGKILLS